MEQNAVLPALRDFFAASGGREMVLALKALDEAEGNAASSPPPDADETEFAFNRLFVGPGRVPAPPYASVYLDPEWRLMGRASLRAGAVYDALGLASPHPGSMPADHLALELDAALAFSTLAEGGADPRLAQLKNYFLHDHLASWLPRFIAAASKEPEMPPAIGRVLLALESWLARETGGEAKDAFQPGDMA